MKISLAQEIKLKAEREESGTSEKHLSQVGRQWRANLR